MPFWDSVVAAWNAVREFLHSLFFESYLLQAAVVLLLLLLPSAVRALRRVLFIRKIKAVCKSRGFTFCAHRRGFSQGNYKNAACEFSVLTETRAFAVKLVGTKRKSHHLRLNNEENLEIIKPTALFAGGRRLRASGLPEKVKWHPHPTWEFFTDDDRGRKTEHVLLCHPTPASVSYRGRRANGEPTLIRLKDGMRVFEMLYHTPEGFLEKLSTLRESYLLYTDKT